MSFGNIGFPEILVILVIVLLLFGAKRIPEIAGSMGKGIREFKRSISDVDKSIREPERDSGALGARERDYAADRLQGAQRDPQGEPQREEDRPEPRRLMS